jgi:hypothetical protein
MMTAMRGELQKFPRRVGETLKPAIAEAVVDALEARPVGSKLTWMMPGCWPQRVRLSCHSMCWQLSGWVRFQPSRRSSLAPNLVDLHGAADTMLELLMMCAPAVDPVTMAAVVKQESGGQPWVINNNTTRKSATFESKAAAVAAAVAAVGRGESVRYGLGANQQQESACVGVCRWPKCSTRAPTLLPGQVF